MVLDEFSPGKEHGALQAVAEVVVDQDVDPAVFDPIILVQV